MSKNTKKKKSTFKEKVLKKLGLKKYSHKRKKGFTLIELLAVIVILGLLMAIAIPSVTKYITESRKKTLTTTLGNYISALVNEVNDLEYTFTGTNTIYAVPIECISLERGGTNPFGHWYQANDAYFAYVLVQYDDTTSKYVYGFTFKDSAGYGLYPTIQPNINEKGSQIKTGYDLNKPKTGKLTSLTTFAKWQESGFKVDVSTHLQVLTATSEGETGDGIKTCTLQQKGDNYAQVEEEKLDDIDDELHFGKAYETTIDGELHTIVFYEDGSVDMYVNCDMQHSYENNSFYYDNGEIIYLNWFEPFYKISEDKKSITEIFLEEDSVYSLNKNSTCNYKLNNFLQFTYWDDPYAFWPYKENIKTITFENSINIPSDVREDHKWDVSRLKNGKVMAYIIPNSSNSSYYDLYIQGDGKIYANPDSSYWFSGFTNADKINNIELLDTSNVVNMHSMFIRFGYNISSFNFDLGNNFDTSHVKDMGFMFQNVGHNSTNFTFNLGTKFDTSNVTTMEYMFSLMGTYSQNLKLDLGDRFDTSKVTDMSHMFSDCGAASSVFTLNLGNNFNTSKVTNMSSMFSGVGKSSTVFTLDLGTKFDTKKVTNMSYMFDGVGRANPNFTLNLGNKFDTSNVTSMSLMFYYTGTSSSIFKVDCSNWNVDKVNSYSNFNLGADDKVIAPHWKN